MALFVDGPAAAIDYLTDQDSGFLDVAETCGINANTKLRLAHQQIEDELMIWLARPGPTLYPVLAPIPHIEQVVITPTLKRWESMLALTLFYRDAYFSQLVDRYQARWEEYLSLSGDEYERFVASGMGIVTTPLRKASLASLGSTAGPQQGGIFYARVAWVNAAGQEGQASDPSSLSIADNFLLTVSAGTVPPDATGFNVYAGSSEAAMTLQNVVPLSPGASFTYVPGFATRGRLPGLGQNPDYTLPLVRTILRG